RVLATGIVLTTCAAIAFLRFGYDALDRQFWKFHTPWLFLLIAIIFVSLPGDQRYYLMVFAPLLVVMLRGFLRLPKWWNLSAICVPPWHRYLVRPWGIAHHRDESTPVPPLRPKHSVELT